LGFEFDNDNDGVRENGDDIVLTTASAPQNVQGPAADFHRYNGGVGNKADIADGGTADAITAWGAIGTKGVFEFRHPLNSADDTHDISINPVNGAVSVGLEMMVKLEMGAVGSGTYVTTHHPSSTTYCKLTIGKITVSVSCP